MPGQSGAAKPNKAMQLPVSVTVNCGGRLNNLLTSSLSISQIPPFASGLAIAAA
jgi:hypothetical protein